MDRKEFLSLVGLSASAVVLTCLGGCSKGQGVSAPPPSNVDFTLDLTQTANAQLQNKGGFVYANGIIVAHTLNDQYIAVQQTCTHQSFTVSYVANSHMFYCSGHGATFSESGAVTGGPAPGPLAQYKTSLSGNMLRVYS